MTVLAAFRWAAAAVLAGAIWFATPEVVVAQSLEDRVIQTLHDEGYVRINRSRTLLGRVRIIGLRRGILREVVIDPRTNEILRDVEFRSDRIPDIPPPDPSSPRRGNGG